jgi:hypothetical protein
MKHQTIKLKNLLRGPEKDLSGPDLARGLHFAHPWITPMFLNRCAATH